MLLLINKINYSQVDILGTHQISNPAANNSDVKTLLLILKKNDNP